MFNNNMMMGGMIPLKLANRNCTINGKPMQQVEEELLEGLPEDLLKETHDNYSYFPAEVLIERLEAVVGPLNFTVVPIPVPSEPMHYIARPNKVALQKQRADAENEAKAKKLKKSVNELSEEEKVKYWNIEIPPEELEPYECVEFLEKVVSAIAVYSDDGELAIIKYAYGCAKYDYVNATGKLKESKNIPDTAVSDATKRACHDFGIGSQQLAQKKKQADKKKDKREEVFVIRLLKNFSSLKNGEYFTCPVRNEKTNEQLDLFIGDKSCLSEHNKQTLVRAAAGQRVTLRGIRGEFNHKPKIDLIDVVTDMGGNGNG